MSLFVVLINSAVVSFPVELRLRSKVGGGDFHGKMCSLLALGLLPQGDCSWPSLLNESDSCVHLSAGRPGKLPTMDFSRVHTESYRVTTIGCVTRLTTKTQIDSSTRFVASRPSSGTCRECFLRRIAGRCGATSLDAPVQIAELFKPHMLSCLAENVENADAGRSRVCAVQIGFWRSKQRSGGRPAPRRWNSARSRRLAGRRLACSYKLPHRR